MTQRNPWPAPPSAVDFRDWREMLRQRLQFTPGLAKPEVQQKLRQAVAVLLPEGRRAESSTEDAALAMDAWDGVLAFLAALSNGPTLTLDEWLAELARISAPPAAN